MRIPSRGFEFELDPPMPVTVLEGTIRGNARDPIEGPIPKPGVRYPPPPLEEEPIDAVTTASGRVKDTAPASVKDNAAASKGAP
jgi:hypothetical protein